MFSLVAIAMLKKKKDVARQMSGEKGQSFMSLLFISNLKVPLTVGELENVIFNFSFSLWSSPPNFAVL